MGNILAFSILLIPVTIGIFVLLCVAFTSPKLQRTDKAFLGLGRRRIVFGYLGALVSVLIYCFVLSVFAGYLRIDNGQVTTNKIFDLMPGWTFVQFVLISPFVAFILTVVGLPVLSILRRIHMVSLTGIFLACLVSSIAWAAWAFFQPDNSWCQSHQIQCSAKAFISIFLITAVIALGFGLAAKLPWLKSE